MSEVNDIDTLGMSDAEFMEQLGSGRLDDVASEAEADSESEETVIEEEAASATDEDTQEDTGDDFNETDSDDEDDSEADVSEDEESENGKDEDKDDTENLDGDDETSKSENEPGDDDKELDHKRIFEPFKANGTEMQVDNVDDVIKLMQMGANYTQKLQKLQPALKIVKMLENNDLMDQDKLNNLIDLHKRNPKAITKLIKDSGIDPLDIDTKEDVDYRPEDHGISDSAFQLDQAIDEIRGNESFDRSIDIMGKQWDQRSRDTIAQHPEIVTTIDAHVQSGIFDEVQKFVNKEKALGRMVGMSDVEAYREGVNALQESGVLLNPQNNSVNEGGKKKKPNALEKEVKAKKAAKVKKKKKAAGLTKKTSPKASKQSEDFLNMPDDEFMKKYGQG